MRLITSSPPPTFAQAPSSPCRATPDLSDTDADAHLPKVAYDIHPQRRIAEMLAEWDLPTHGDKAALARRHARWVVLYNANVDRDARQRRTVEQLRQELRRAEDADRKSTRLNSSHSGESRMPSSA